MKRENSTMHLLDPICMSFFSGQGAEGLLTRLVLGRYPVRIRVILPANSTRYKYRVNSLFVTRFSETCCMAVIR